MSWLLAIASLASALGAAQAQAALPIETFSGSLRNADGQPANQAGERPFTASTSIRFPMQSDGFAAEDLRTAIASLPPGFIGSPSAVQKCPANADLKFGECPVSSQVGVATPIFRNGTTATEGGFAVYNLEPPPGVPARFAFNAAFPDVILDARLRPDDFGVDVVSRNVSQGLGLVGFDLTFWGVPGDPAHDDRRAHCAPQPPGSGCSISVSERTPFLATPTNCAAGLLETTLTVDSWQDPGVFDTASFDHDVSFDPAVPMAVKGCERLDFRPSIAVQPTSRAADAPAGLAVTLAIPQDDSPDGLATAHLKKATVALPEGMSINPSAADGLDGCSDTQLRLGLEGPARCPEGAKIGTVSVDTPLLDEQLDGSVYIRSQNSGDPTSGEMFRIAIEVRSDERGIAIKLPGQVRVDSRTGRLVTTFDNNPQLPFDEMRLRFKGGTRAPLATPSSCGEHRVDSELTSWSGQTVDLTDSFTIDCPGQAGFAPVFEAGAVVPTGGSFSPFTARIARNDRQQFLSGVQVDMPKGLIAKLKGVELCPDVVAGDGTSGTCPAGSRIGTATVGAGSGSPFFLQGDVYLTGPYKGGPYGLSVQVPAKAGPFDLGMVKVRQAIYVDPTTAELSVVSDPLPQIVKGVPVRLRGVNVDVDKPGFTINPTSCAEKRVEATLTSVAGAVHKTGSRFQVGDCASLAFEPKLALRLSGKRQRSTGGHPGLRAVLTQAPGQANIEAVKVKLPSSIALDPKNANGLCKYDEGLKVKGGAVGCPASSVIGQATAYTPVLNKPLTGKVYFVERKQRSRQGHLISKLPSLLVALRGEVAIDLRANSDVIDGRLVNTFSTVPDAPVSKFDMRLKGGDGGILTVTRSRARKFDVCRGSHIAAVEADGQNGKHADFGVRMTSPCAAGRQAKRAAAKRKAAGRRAAIDRKGSR